MNLDNSPTDLEVRRIARLVGVEPAELVGLEAAPLTDLRTLREQIASRLFDEGADSWERAAAVAGVVPSGLAAKLAQGARRGRRGPASPPAGRGCVGGGQGRAAAVRLSHAARIVQPVGLFDRFRRPRDEGKPSSARGPSAEALGELKAFLDDRTGVEGYIEPPTAVYAMTLLLVAGDGEYLRRPVKHEKQARKLCDDHGVPLYEARRVGYPQRMKDYERGIRRKSISLEDLPPLD